MPHEAAEYILSNSSILFDPEISSTLIKNIAVYPEGSIVLLNTGEIGSVIEANKRTSLMPKVRVITRKEGPPIYQPYVIDLTENPGTYVVDILS